MSTLYASFVDASAAEKAAGALLDQGAAASDMSIVANTQPNSVHAVNENEHAADAERSAKAGISTTTAADAATGAAKGVTVGIGVGIAAALASIFIPGLGIVIGGGALATALAGGAATAAAGGVAGGVVGYLRDQGVPDAMVTHYNDHFLQGGAILAIAIPTGSLRSVEIEAYLLKYGASNIATYNLPGLPADAIPSGLPPVRNATVVDASTGESRDVQVPATGVTMFERPIDRIADEDPVAAPPAAGEDVRLY